MASESIRNLIWQELLDVARLVRYYEALTDKYVLRDRVLKTVLLLSASASIAALLEALPNWVQLIAGLGIAVCIVTDFVMNFARKAAVLHAISTECSFLQNQIELLWAQVQDASGDEEEIKRDYIQLDQRLNTITSWARHANIREDKGLNESCAQAAYTVIGNKYAG